MKLIDKTKEIVTNTKFLTGVAVTGTIVTPVLASRATLKAKDIIDESDAEIWYKDKETRRKVEKAYIPTFISGGITIGCIIGCEKLSADKIGELTAAGVVLADKCKYLEQTIVDKDASKLVSEVHKANPEAVPVENKLQDIDELVLNADSMFWIWDDIAKDYIRTSANELAVATLRLNQSFLSYYYGSGQFTWNEFRKCLGAKPCEEGDKWGWSQENVDLMEWMSYNGEMMIDCRVFGSEGIDPKVNEDGSKTFAYSIAFNYGPMEIPD